MKTDLKIDFPIFQNQESLVYLDSAATTHKPSIVLETMDKFYKESYGTVHRGIYSLSLQATESYDLARKKIQSFIHAKEPNEIIFTRGATHSLNLLALSFGRAFLKPTDVVLLSEVEHHANLIPWQMLAKEMGIVLRFMPVNDEGEIIFDAFLDLLDERVKLISIAHLSNVLGTIHPVDRIIEKAHERGIYVCLDGAQAVAHLPVNVQELDVDFYVFSGHKLYGPTGVGVLYGKRELLEKMPPVEGGGDMVREVTLDAASYQDIPLKFEGGTPMIAEIIGFGSAIDYLSSIGMETIRSIEKELLDYATERLLEIPDMCLIGTAREKGAIISFIIEGIHPSDIATLLDLRKIAIRSGHHCSQPTMKRFNVSSTCRLSFGIYNTKEEIDFFLTSLHEILSFLT